MDMKEITGSPKEWDHTLMVFGSSEMIDTAKAVISAVNYDEVCCPASLPSLMMKATRSLNREHTDSRAVTEVEVCSCA